MTMEPVKTMVEAYYDQVIFVETENPFIKVKYDSGLYIPEGLAFTQETGEMEKMDQVIGTGIVCAVGDECKKTQVGDMIYYDRRSIRALPAEQAFWMMSERGLAGRIPGDSLELKAQREKYLADKQGLTNDLKANAANEAKLREKQILETQVEVEKLREAGKLTPISPLIKIK